MGMAADLVRRFMPEADRRTLTVAAIWLIGQCSVFVRNRDRLAEPPIGLELDDAMVEWLAHTISRWLMAGLGGLSSQPAAKCSLSRLARKVGECPKNSFFRASQPPRTNV